METVHDGNPIKIQEFYEISMPGHQLLDLLIPIQYSK